MGESDPDFIAERQAGLQDFLDGVLELDPMVSLPVLRNFLDFAPLGRRPDGLRRQDSNQLKHTKLDRLDSRDSLSSASGRRSSGGELRRQLSDQVSASPLASALVP